MTRSGKTSIVFFGSGPVAARCLELLLAHARIEAVITKPRPAHHRYEAPVIAMASRHNLPILTAANKSELDTLIANTKFTSNLAVLIDFGIIVSQKVIDSFPLGIINSHFSLLPRWRGADPITFAITSGDTKNRREPNDTIDKGMDTGKLLTYRTLHLDPSETAITLTARLIILSDELLKEFVPQYIAGAVKPKTSHPDRATYSRKLTKQDGIIDWSLPAEQIEQYPRLQNIDNRAVIGGTKILITGAKVVSGNGTPGDYTVSGKELVVFTGSKTLSITTLKPAGKKKCLLRHFLLVQS